MEKAVITVEGLLWILGTIALIGGATAVISRWFTPWRKQKEEVKTLKAEHKNTKEEIKSLKEELKTTKEEVKTLKEEFKTLTNYQNCDHEELKKVELGIEKICKCTLAITDHELTGNSVDKLREAKDEMQDYLISK